LEPQLITVGSMSDQTEDLKRPTNLKRSFGAALALWLTLVCWALSSPINSTPDEGYHIPSIWCGQGVQEPKCLSMPGNADVRVVRVPDLSNLCFRKSVCNQQSEHALSGAGILNGNYPKPYYWTMNYFVGPNMTQSILAMRVFNSTIAALFFFSQAILCTNKKYISWLTGFTFTIIPLGMSLIASINPSGWAITGTLNSWMFLLIAKTLPKENWRKRIVAWALWALSGFMCIASRFDATIFLIVTNLIVLIATDVRIAKLNWKFLIGIPAVTFSFFAVLRNQLPFLNWTLNWLTHFNTESLNPNGPSLHIWITHWMINVVSIPIEAFGEGRLGAEIVDIPRVVPILGIALLGAALLFAFVQVNRKQVFVTVTSFMLMTAVVMRIANMELDLFNVSGRYILPLVPYIVGSCIYFSSSPLQLMEVSQLRRIVIVCMTIAHTLSLYAVVEQNVMGTSFGIQILEVGTEEWWWEKSPVGPNFFILIGSISFYRFISQAWDRVPTKTFSVQPQSFQS
jgi:hypothetical protein